MIVYPTNYLKWPCPKSPTPAEKCFHMSWHCRKIHTFCSEITNFNATLLAPPNICNSVWCLLGYFEDNIMPNQAKIPSSLRVITWKSSDTPALNCWVRLVNKALPLYKLGNSGPPILYIWKKMF